MGQNQGAHYYDSAAISDLPGQLKTDDNQRKPPMEAENRSC